MTDLEKKLRDIWMFFPDREKYSTWIGKVLEKEDRG